MDREQTPLKQRQKRGTARNAPAKATSERAFRSNSVSQRGRGKITDVENGPPPAKPPLTILRANSSSGGGGSSHPPSPSATTSVPPKTLYSPPPPPSRGVTTPQRNSMLRVNTAPSPTIAPYASPSPSPLAVAGTPQPVRKPTTPGGGAGPPPVLQRAPALPPFVSAPPTATKLITSNFQFASDIPTRLASCLELTNFTVVGTLGFEGVGKSTLLSLLARLAFATASDAETAFSAMDTIRDRSKNQHFIAQRLETQLAGLQETQGVDLAVVCEAPRLRANTGGLVLLDSQPLLSASNVADVLARNESSGAAVAAAARFGALSPEQQNELSSIQIAVLLLSVCHYVIVPVRSDAIGDLEMIEFLRKVQEKMEQSRLPNVAGHVVKEKHHAQLLFVANEAATAHATPSDRQAMKSLAHVLSPEWIYGDGDALWKFTTVDATATPRTVDEWRARVLAWARFIESLPASPSFTKPTASAPMTAGATPLTLKEWLSSTARVWEGVKRSSALSEEYTTRDHY